MSPHIMQTEFSMPCVALYLTLSWTRRIHSYNKKPTRCTISLLYFGKELYMFQTDLLSIIRSLNTVFTATGLCHTCQHN